jgi:uncharacterized Ntn-hydrolase superfamily protein
VSTYSIVARDAATGEVGVAVQSHWFSVGPIVPWAEAGVGAVATQSLVKVSYGPDGLRLMRDGASAKDALARLLKEDDGSAVRQVAMVDARGGVATHTGDRCIAHAEHVSETTADGCVYSAQANLMRREGVPEAMQKAFRAGAGTPLAERMVAALRAAEGAGGDVRGRQSAAILVVSGTPSGAPWRDRIFDLRVEDHPQPVEELKRLVRVARAYQKMNEGDELFALGKIDEAAKAYGTAATLNPDNSEMVFWHAVTLAGAGRVEPSLPLFRRAFAADTNWRLLVPRLPASGLLPADRALIDRILSVRP